MGEGFYEPIDDIGPDRTPSAPKTVEYLSQSFAKSGYDVKWLLNVICATDAYQRESRPRREEDGTPFVATVAQPLRGDQLFNAFLTATEVDETAQALPIGKAAVRRTGSDVTLIAYGGSLPKCLEAADGLAKNDARTGVLAGHVENFLCRAHLIG